MTTPATAPPGNITRADAPHLRVPVDSLTTYHRNPRRGDTRAIAASLDINGQYRPITVNIGTHTGRYREVLAGNHTLAAARELGWATIAATFVDVDDTAATRIVLADNRTSDLATYDTPALGALLTDLAGDYDGTGYDPNDVDAIANALADLDPKLPTGPTPGLRSDRTRMIECPSCHHEFDSTSAIETRTPTGGRA